MASSVRRYGLLCLLVLVLHLLSVSAQTEVVEAEADVIEESDKPIIASAGGGSTEDASGHPNAPPTPHPIHHPSTLPPLTPLTLPPSFLSDHPLHHLPFTGAFIASISMILVSEFGDKTFFIAAIMAMRQSRTEVFLSAMTALVVMTILSAAMGLTLPHLLDPKLTAAAATVLFSSLVSSCCTTPT